MVKKIYYLILPIILLLFLIIRFIIPDLSKDSGCITYKEFLKMNLDGIVLKKYIDSSQHSYPIVEVQSLSDLKIEKLNLILERSSLYNKINILDTLKKELGSNEVFVIKNDKKELLSKLDFGCTDQ